MEITSFIIGLALGLISLDMNRILFIIRIILSSYVSFITLRLHYNNIFIWHVSDYNDKNLRLLYHSDFFNASILMTIFWFLIFYYLVPLLLSSLKINSINTKIKASFDKLTNSDINDLMIFVIKKIRKPYNILKSLSPYKSLFKLEKSQIQELNYNEFVDGIKKIVSIIIHACVCLLFLHYSNMFIGLLIVIIILFLLTLLFISPIYYHFRKQVNDILIQINDNKL